MIEQLPALTSYWIEVNADGTLRQYSVSPDQPRAMYGGTVHRIAHAIDASRYMYVDDALLDLGERPSFDHWIDPAARAWVLVLTDAEKIEAVRARLQRVMDDAARALGYDDIKTAITYADEPAVPKFQAEGQALRAWRSLVWAACYAHPAMTGAAPIPTPDEAEALMPPLALPDA
ncbi:MAG: hypothetical protein I8H71_01145 [Xanthomonadaceae bacterium]|nr:hypothetical protein [Xanthomonadaceae bacterium]